MTTETEYRGLRRAARRGHAARKAKHGMRRSGDSVKTLAAIAVRRAAEARA